MIVTNLPPDEKIITSEEYRDIFDKFFQNKISFPTNQIDAVVGFFMKRGFYEQAAKSTAIVLLNQARIDNINVFKLIETLTSLSDPDLSKVVTQVLNAYREKTSMLGFKLDNVEETTESRNIRL